MSSSLLNDASRAGLYHLPPARRVELLKMVSRAHLSLLSVELGACQELGEILVDLGMALHFPPWYGANLDALNDCLGDPAWRPERGAVILLSGLEALQGCDPESFSRLLEVLAAATTSQSSAQAPLWVLLTTPARGIAPLPEA